MTCIKMCSDESHFNVSLIVRDKVTRPCSQTTTFEEKGEPKRYRTRSFRLPAYRLTAKPNRLSFVFCFLKLITIALNYNLSHMLCRHPHKYKRIYLNHWTKKLNKQVYSLQKHCSFHIFLIGTGIDPCFRYQDSQEWQQSSPQSPKPYSLSRALCKSKKIFSWCLTLSCDDVPWN